MIRDVCRRLHSAADTETVIATSVDNGANKHLWLSVATSSKTQLNTHKADPPSEPRNSQDKRSTSWSCCRKNTRVQPQETAPLEPTAISRVDPSLLSGSQLMCLVTTLMLQTPVLATHVAGNVHASGLSIIEQVLSDDKEGNIYNHSTDTKTVVAMLLQLGVIVKFEETPVAPTPGTIPAGHTSPAPSHKDQNGVATSARDFYRVNLMAAASIAGVGVLHRGFVFHINQPTHVENYITVGKCRKRSRYHDPATAIALGWHLYASAHAEI